MTDTNPADPDDLLGLPGWVYSNAGFFAAERDRVFAPSWQVVCHLNDIPREGDFHTFEFIGESIVVVRGRDGVPRAFSNVCLHRGRRCSTDQPVSAAVSSVPITPGPMIWMAGSLAFPSERPIRTRIWTNGACRRSSWKCSRALFSSGWRAAGPVWRR